MSVLHMMWNHRDWSKLDQAAVRVVRLKGQTSRKVNLSRFLAEARFGIALSCMTHANFGPFVIPLYPHVGRNASLDYASVASKQVAFVIHRMQWMAFVIPKLWGGSKLKGAKTGNYA